MTDKKKSRNRLSSPKAHLKRFYVIGTRSSQLFASSIARSVCARLGRSEVFSFADGALHVRIVSKIKGKAVMVVGQTGSPAKNAIELLLTINAVKNAGAKSIRVLIPFDGFARQDRVVFSGDTVAAQAIARAVCAQGIDECAVIDIHSPRSFSYYKSAGCRQVRGLVPLKWIVLEIKRIRRKFPGEKIVLVAPDHGARRKVGLLSKASGINDVVQISKLRPGRDTVKVCLEEGIVGGKVAVIVDDIVSTGSTIIKAASVLKKAGAVKVFVFATHPVLAGIASKALQGSVIDEVHVSNTIPVLRGKGFRKLRIHDISREVLLN